jgi:DNA ligase-1
MITLYKTDSVGKLRVLNLWTEGDLLKQSAGVHLGNLVVQEKVCNPKNQGKSNETTSAEQAELEMHSKAKNKLDSGYYASVVEAMNTKLILPMLAKDYKKESKKIKWKEVLIQPKLDGMRCLAFIKEGTVKLMSRKGKQIETMQHIEQALLKQFPKEEIILDGELYIHGETFQGNMRLIKKYRPGESEKITYHIYDVVNDKPYLDRQYTVDVEHLKSVSTRRIYTEKQMKDYHVKYIAAGYEGTIIRHGDTGYEIDKRSSSLLKYKDFIDLALPIIGMEPAEARPTWGVPIFSLNGKEFRSGVRGTHTERELMLTVKHVYIGKTAELRFFEYSEDGIPRFPVMVGMRLDK